MTLPRFRMVIALDGSEYSEIVLEHALDQASRHDMPDLHVLRVIERGDDVTLAKNRLAAQVIEGLDSFADGKRDWRTRLHVREGHPVDEIANLAAEVAADLIVIGRFGVHHRWRSTADRLLTSAPCPTLVVGMTQRTVDTQPMCPACVAAREDSDGERWFCADHIAPDRLRLSTLVPGTTQAHGGLW
jgi:nucleotide-binding universal stress UspA family protein